MADAYRVADREPDLNEIILQAVEHHRQGRLSEAARGYDTVLAWSPGHADALHFLGVLHHQRGNSAEALRCIAAASKANRASVEILANYAFMLEAAGRSADALAVYDRALIIHPSDADVLFNRGNALLRLGRHKQAAKSFEDVLEIKPDHTGALNNLGTTLRGLGRCEESLVYFTRALALRPDDLSALNNCATALQGLDRHAEALACFEKALAVTPRHADVLCNRACSLRELGRFDEALAAFEAALSANPGHAPALYNRGNLLRDRGRHQEAIASYDAALAVQSNHTDALYNRGNALLDLKRFEEGIASFDRAIEVDPEFAAAFNNRGLALTQLHRYDEALVSLGKAAALAPANAEFSVNEGVARLRVGDLAGGWAKYEARLQLPNGPDAPRRESASWRGETSLRGRTVLLHAEGGPDDTLQFARYITPIVASGGRVVLEVQPEFAELMAGVHGVAAVVGKGEKAPAHDVHCPLPSLPLAFSTTLETIPAAVPYVRAPAERVRTWTTRVLEMKSPLIGFHWTGELSGKKAREPSIPLEQFLTLLDHPSARFVGLPGDVQRGDTMHLAQQRAVTHLGPQLQDVGDLAAVISLLDLVVTMDGPVAHLAGALGRPVWVLLPFRAHHRWMLNRDDTPWYPTARLFRQPAEGDWAKVIADVRRAMAAQVF
jgi:tetratricopeptide (TPR) repeat protein